MLLLFLASSLSFAAPTTVSGQRNPDAETANEPLADMGRLVIESRVPTEVLVDGHKMMQLFTSGTSMFDVRPGKRRVRVYTNGNPQDLVVEIMPTGETILIVGRTGITTGQRTAAENPTDAVAKISFRAAGDIASQIRLGKERFTVQPDTIYPLELAAGRHDISVRSADGTAIWASGVLTLDGGKVVVQVAEGRLPEVTGDGRFTARGG